MAASGEVYSAELCGALDELTSLSCAFAPDERAAAPPGSTSDFHFQLLKSRTVVFGEFGGGGALACPDPNDPKRIVVVFGRRATDASRLRAHLEKLRLKTVSVAEASPGRLEACVRYSLQAKLSPLWNPLEADLLVRGRDFLVAPDRGLKAVSLRVYASENSLRLRVQPYKIILRSVEARDLILHRDALRYFEDVDDAVLSENSLMDRWIYVLPSLKKGKIIRICKQFPSSPSFATYRELRRHWKNLYGYRLPETDEGMIFFEIHFPPLGPHLYTYPSICLCQNFPAPISIPPYEQVEIRNDFLKDVREKFSFNLLGQKLEFRSLDCTSQSFKILGAPFLHDNGKNTPKLHDTEESINNNEDSVKIKSSENIPKIKPTFTSKNSWPKYDVNASSSLDAGAQEPNLSKIVPTFTIGPNKTLTKYNINDSPSNECLEQKVSKIVSPFGAKDVLLSKVGGGPSKSSLLSNDGATDIANTPPIGVAADNIFWNDNAITSEEALESFFRENYDISQSVPAGSQQILSQKSNESSPEKYKDFSSFVFDSLKSANKRGKENIPSFVPSYSPSSQTSGGGKATRKMSRKLPDVISDEDILNMARINPKGLSTCTREKLYSFIRAKNGFVSKSTKKADMITKILEMVWKQEI